jgi:hypothetical protein
MRLSGASYAGRRDTDAVAGAPGGGMGGVVRDADTTGSAEDGSEGGGQGREALGDVIEDDGGDNTGEGSQRSVHGIVEMRQVRLFFKASLAPRPSTWRYPFSCPLDGVCISLSLPANGLCWLFVLGGFPCVSQPPLTSRGACACLHLSPLLSPPPQIVNRLVRRIHYSAFACPSKET